MCFRIIIISGYKLRKLTPTENVIIIEQKPTRIIEGKWSIIHKLDIKPIGNSLENIRDSVKYAINRSKIEDYKHIYQRISIILDHIEEICKHLNIQSRVKRGLVNGLGSVIKAITGNLDQNDLDQIQKGLETLRVAYNKQISITDDTLEEYNKQLNNITKIQQEINEQFMTVFNNKIQQKVALALLLQAQTLQDIAERLSTAITFAEHGMFHYEILQSHILEETLNNIPKDNMISKNLNDIESFIKVSCKIIDNTAYFIISIPLVKSKIYNTRQIVPIIQNNPSCSFPIMRKVTLAYDSEEMYETRNCLELNNLICEGEVVATDSCETEILYQKESNKCKTVPIKCPLQEILEISSKTIYMYFNKTTEVSVDCNNHTEITWLKGSNILFGENCKLNISGVKMFQTKQSSDKIIIANIDIPRIETISEIELTYDPSKVEDKLKQLKSIETLDESKQHRIIQYSWVTTLTVVIILIFLFKFLRSRIHSKFRTSNLEGVSHATQNQELCFKKDPMNTKDLVFKENKDITFKDIDTSDIPIVTPWTTNNSIYKKPLKKTIGIVEIQGTV